MDDAISRQAAIDAFDGHFAIVGRSSAERFKMYIEAVINDIRKLPPAQPEIPDDARDAFMNLVYDELHSDGDNNRANRIIDAADEYVEYSLAKQSAQLGTNLAEVGTDCISRQQAIEAFRTYFMDGFDEDKWWNSTHVLAAIEGLPPAEPKRETATVSVGKSKGGVTMWYECAACGEPVDQGDTFCSGCGRRLIHG